jgi:CRP/FNR family cyclic AMP-dependent transcriptional regulator
MSSIPASLFSELAPEHAWSLSEQGTARNYPANAVLIHEGDESDSLYLIEDGECKVVSSEDGRDGAPRSSSVITTKPSCIRAISAVRFREHLAAHPDASLALLHTLARKIRSLTENVRSLAVRDVYGRVVRVLMALSQDAGDGTRQVTRRLTHQEIADMVGASREMVSRILRDLTVGGYIDVVKRRIRIHRKLPARW